jgi:hypothetical protein
VADCSIRVVIPPMNAPRRPDGAGPRRAEATARGRST